MDLPFQWTESDSGEPRHPVQTVVVKISHKAGGKTLFVYANTQSFDAPFFTLPVNTLRHKTKSELITELENLRASEQKYRVMLNE